MAAQYIPFQIIRVNEARVFTYQNMTRGGTMNGAQHHHHLSPGLEDHATDANRLPGVIVTLAALPPNAIVTEEGMAHLFDRHLVSVKRAVERGELPPPCQLFGSRVWTAGILISHIERRLEQAARDAQKDAKRIQSYGGR